MNKPVVIYATFAPEDAAGARSVLDRLQRLRPEMTLLGRHQLGFSPEAGRASEQIQRATITLVLVGRNTFADEAVRQDLEMSRAKQPPNQLLAIYLEGENELSEVGQADGIPEIAGTGGEVITSDDDLNAGIERAVERVHQAERIRRDTDVPRPSGGCNR